MKAPNVGRLPGSPNKVEQALQALEHWAGVTVLNVNLKESRITWEMGLLAMSMNDYLDCIN